MKFLSFRGNAFVRCSLVEERGEQVRVGVYNFSGRYVEFWSDKNSLTQVENENRIEEWVKVPLIWDDGVKAGFYTFGDFYGGTQIQEVPSRNILREDIFVN